MKDEYDSLIQNKTLTLGRLPTDRKAIKSKWIYKTKLAADGSVDRFMSRLLAQGFSQRYGVDYDETFSPVATKLALRILIALRAQNWTVRQIDIDSAYLNADIDEERYISQPEGFEQSGDQRQFLVCRLKKPSMV